MHSHSLPPKRFYVITATGDAGPFTQSELQEEIDAGRIALTDQVRSATGRVLGTVRLVLAGDVHSSSLIVAQDITGHETPKRASSSNANRRFVVPTPATSNSHTGSPSRQPLSSGQTLGILSIIALVVIVAWSFNSSHEPLKAPVSKLPSVIVAPGRTANAAGTAEVLVRITEPLAYDLPVYLNADSTLVTLTRAVIISTGTTTTAAEIVPRNTIHSITPVQIALEEGKKYVLGDPHSTTVNVGTTSTVPPEKVQDKSVAPKIAEIPEPFHPSTTPSLIMWEPFSSHDTSLSGKGWRSPWINAGLTWQQGELLPLSGTAPSNAGGHVLYTSDSAAHRGPYRLMNERIARGTVWMSLIMQGVDLQGHEGGISLVYKGATRTNIGCSIESAPHWFIAPKYGKNLDPVVNSVTIQESVERATFVVVLINLQATMHTFTLWVNPPMDHEPDMANGKTASVPVELIADTIGVYGWTDGITIALDELRMGRTWQDVRRQ